MNDEYRCSVCGCFLGAMDTLAENYDFELVCNNPKCKSNKPVKEQPARRIGEVIESRRDV